MERELLLQYIKKSGHFLHHRKGKKIGQYRILVILYHRGSMHQTDLQHELKIQSGSMSEIVLKLENAGWISRRKDPMDKRKMLLELSENGKIKVLEILEDNEREEKMLLDVLSDEEVALLGQLMEKLLSSWEEEYDFSMFGHHSRR